MLENPELPFDPRTDISADGRYIANRIVLNLWIIFVVIPVFLGIVVLAFRIFA